MRVRDRPPFSPRPRSRGGDPIGLASEATLHRWRPLRSLRSRVPGVLGSMKVSRAWVALISSGHKRPCRTHAKRFLLDPGLSSITNHLYQARGQTWRRCAGISGCSGCRMTPPVSCLTARNLRFIWCRIGMVYASSSFSGRRRASFISATLRLLR